MIHPAILRICLCINNMFRLDWEGQRTVETSKVKGKLNLNNYETTYIAEYILTLATVQTDKRLDYQFLMWRHAHKIVLNFSHSHPYLHSQLSAGPEQVPLLLDAFNHSQAHKYKHHHTSSRSPRKLHILSVDYGECPPWTISHSIRVYAHSYSWADFRYSSIKDTATASTEAVDVQVDHWCIPWVIKFRPHLQCCLESNQGLLATYYETLRLSRLRRCTSILVSACDPEEKRVDHIFLDGVLRARWNEFHSKIMVINTVTCFKAKLLMVVRLYFINEQM